MNPALEQWFSTFRVLLPCNTYLCVLVTRNHYNYFIDKQNNITKLVKLRNSVAHGSQREPIEFSEFEKIEEDILEIMEEIIKYLYRFCLEERYLKVN